jgi:protein involved in polysaccharide export with SLBB domain
MPQDWKGAISIVLLAAIFLHLCGTSPFAQESPRTKSSTEARSPQYYLSLGDENELTIKIFIWGQVGLPGVYEVPDGTDLIAALSLAGGPTDHAKLSEVKIIRSTETTSEVIKVNVKKYMETGDIATIPLLKPGDTVVVSGTVFRMISRFSTFISQLAIVAHVIVLLRN